MSSNRNTLRLYQTNNPLRKYSFKTVNQGFYAFDQIFGQTRGFFNRNNNKPHTHYPPPTTPRYKQKLLWNIHRTHQTWLLVTHVSEIKNLPQRFFPYFETGEDFQGNMATVLR
jgi:hypothetical protein